MTNRYWKTSKEEKQQMELTSEEIKRICDQHPYDYQWQCILAGQRKRKAFLSKKTPYCTITKEPCISPERSCSQCSLETKNH